jgi:hypothetical protein
MNKTIKIESLVPHNLVSKVDNKKLQCAETKGLQLQVYKHELHDNFGKNRI